MKPLNGKAIYYPKMSELVKAREEFRNVFGVSIAPFYDGLSTIFFEKICINPFLFDDFLHKFYGQYEDSGLSMEDIVKEKYGEESLIILKKFL
jgi:hypothetical protein